MGKQAPRLVVAALIVAALVILALQNSSPSLALVFLGIQTVALPLGVWLTIAIALGALTTLAIAALLNLGSAGRHRSSRRRWTVRPDTPPDARPDQDQTTRSPRDFFRRDSPPQDQPRSEPPRSEPPRSEPPSQSPYGDTSPRQDRDRTRGTPPPNPTAAAEDWQAWGQRKAPSRWEDWSEAGSNDPTDEQMTKQQRRDREKADATLYDLDKGWDNTAQDTVYVAPGGSDVEDALDDIADGWEDWDSPDNPLADTAYAEKYDGPDRQSRRDSIYAPPDDTQDDYADWDIDADNESSDQGDRDVYDADYRVIIPPHRPLDDEENQSDRPS